LLHERQTLDDCKRTMIRFLIQERLKFIHNKVMIIDGEAVITGSFNFTKGAEENNGENFLIIHDEKLASL